MMNHFGSFKYENQSDHRNPFETHLVELPGHVHHNWNHHGRQDRGNEPISSSTELVHGAPPRPMMIIPESIIEDRENRMVDFRGGTIREGADETADITLDMKNDVFFKLINGSTSTAAAYMSGQLKLEGNIMQAMKLSSIFKNMQSVISEEAK